LPKRACDRSRRQKTHQYGAAKGLITLTIYSLAKRLSTGKCAKK
jgi:hypothetical protein